MGGEVFSSPGILAPDPSLGINLNLWSVRDRLQELAEDLAVVLDIDVTIADRNLVRIAGTGPYRNRVGSYCASNSAFGCVIRSAGNLFVARAREDSICLGCPLKTNCLEMANLGVPIVLGDKVVGVIGLVAFDNRQRSLLLDKKEKILRFCKYLPNILLGEITSKRLCEGTKHSRIPVASRLLSVGPEDIIGESKNMLRLKAIITKAASSDSTVLITGESGTGKELVARSIHCLSERRDSPFVPVNCGAIPESLIESELFGYEQGAFTGARKGGKPGLFEVAHGGSIFLDEITELALHLQGKLHRVLQEMTITRVGANLSKQVDVRVIAASNRNLKELLHHNEFREDLYYRLNVVPIHIPPLRERIEDIPLLVNFFLEKFRGIFSRDIAGVTRELMDFFMGYSWPGNIRQLENFIEYGVNFCEGDTLDLKTMTPHIQGYEKDFLDQLHVPYKADNETLSTSLLEMEANKLVEALRECGCSFEGKKLVAARLGVSQATLYRKLKRHGLTRLGEKAEATVESIRNDKSLEGILNIDNDDQTGMPPALPGDSRGFDRLRRQR